MTSPFTVGRGQFVGRVAANTPLCRDHYRLVLRLPNFPETAPGQFVQVACRDLTTDVDMEREIQWRDDAPPQFVGETLAGPGTLLRRPFSLAGRVDTGEGVELHLIHRVVGRGTDWLARLRPGDAVHLLGPLGNRFAIPPAGAEAVLVGGGVGIPPMLYLAEKLAGKSAVAFAGALTRALLPLTVTRDGSPGAADDATPQMNVAEFARHGVRAVVSTDDGSLGFRGFVTQALERYLDARPTDAGPAVVYTCGPEPMMRRVADIAAARGLECQVAVERAMACGMGTCQSCCIRVKKPDPAAVPLPGREWAWRLACTDGPIFRGADLLW